MMSRRHKQPAAARRLVAGVLSRKDVASREGEREGGISRCACRRDGAPGRAAGGRVMPLGGAAPRAHVGADESGSVCGRWCVLRMAMLAWLAWKAAVVSAT